MTGLELFLLGAVCGMILTMIFGKPPDSRHYH